MIIDQRLQLPEGVAIDVVLDLRKASFPHPGRAQRLPRRDLELPGLVFVASVRFLLYSLSLRRESASPGRKSVRGGRPTLPIDLCTSCACAGICTAIWGLDPRPGRETPSVICWIG